MSKGALYTPDGAPIRLAGLVGKGGEGAVYEVAGPEEVSLAVKLYSAGAADRAAKIDYMVRQRFAERASLAAFPLQVVMNREGRVVGFLMRLVKHHKPLFELVSPGARKRHFPQVDYRFLVRTGANLARAVADMNQSGCVIGDINHSGVLVGGDATVRLIDADSFQVCDDSHTYFCKVGVPEYTPPELQGRHLGTIVRTPNHDAFGLAVSMFQLLWMGRHPFAGIPVTGELPIHEAIKAGKFPYARGGCRGFAAPRSAPRLDEFPSALADAFEGAFLNPRGNRPSAAEWVDVLQRTERSLKSCSKNKRHYYPNTATSCLWCRVAETQGVELFPTAGSPAITLADPGAANFDLQAVWAKITAIAPPTIIGLPQVSGPPPKPTQEAIEARSSLSGKRLLPAAVLFGAAALLIIYPTAWIIWIAVGWWALVQVSGTATPPVKFKSRVQELDRKWELALDEWRQRPTAQFQRVLSELADAKHDYEALSARKVSEIDAIRARHRRSELANFLRSQHLSQYAIVGVGPGRMAMLHRHGINTADDVTPSRLLNIPGFGPGLAAPLLAWRSRLERQFTPSRTIASAEGAEIQLIEAKLAREAGELRSKLASGPLRLRQVCNAAQQPTADPTLNQIHRARLQAHVDARYLGVDPTPRLIPISRPRPTPLPSAPVRPTSRPAFKVNPKPPPAVFQGSPSCPRCGSSMVRRTARRGRNRGSQFWGCSRYFSAGCSGTRRI